MARNIYYFGGNSDTESSSDTETEPRFTDPRHTDPLGNRPPHTRSSSPGDAPESGDDLPEWRPHKPAYHAEPGYAASDHTGMGPSSRPHTGESIDVPMTDPDTGAIFEPYVVSSEHIGTHSTEPEQSVDEEDVYASDEELAFDDDECAEAEPPKATYTPTHDVFADDPTEEIPHQTSTFNMSPFILGLGNYINKWHMSREQYQDFKGIMRLVRPSDLDALPVNLQVMRDSLDKTLPLLRQRKRELQLNQAKIPTRHKHKEDIVLFDMLGVLTRLLHSDTVKQRGYFGMAEIVDEPQEFFHSDSWASSNRTTSGEFAMLRRSNASTAEPILTSEFIWYRTPGASDPFLGRVISVGKEKREGFKGSATYNKVKLTIAKLYVPEDILEDSIRASVMKATPRLHASKTELLIAENEPLVYITEDQAVKRENGVFLDYNFSVASTTVPRECIFVVRWVYSRGQSPTVRPLALSHPHRGELEIKEYTRDGIIGKLCSGHKAFSLPYTNFIDAFGLYRNMYRSVTGVYMQWAFLRAGDRKRQANVFPFTLGPFAAKWEDIVDSMIHISHLQFGADIYLDDGTPATIVAPCLAYVGDMPQQQANAGCKSQNAEYFCRHCLIDTENRANLEYNTVLNGRYHYEMLRVRQEAARTSKRGRMEIFQQLGLSEEDTALRKLTPALDMIRNTPGDAAHSEFKGIGKQLITILFNDILKPSFHEAFAAAFAALPTPIGWPRNQNLKRYYGSYSMQEFGRATIMLPVVLRKFLAPSGIHIRKRYLNAVEDVLQGRSDKSNYANVDFIVHCFVMVAKSNTLFLGPSLKAQDRAWVQEIALEGRKRYQDLLSFAIRASLNETRPTQQAVGNPTSRSSIHRRHSSSMSGNSDGGSTHSYTASDTHVGSGSDTAFGDEEDVQYIQLEGTAVAREEARRKALERKLSTPNVHTIVHFYDICAQYASTVNVLTLQGEDRHR